MIGLLQITAPHFCAGLVVQKGIVIEAAPILRWAKGKRWVEVQDYFNRKGWEIAVADEGD